jgi:hypothetical protein
MVGNKWKKRSNMSIGLVNVPFLSMITFSNTWGIGLNGARDMNTAITIRIEYGILSTIAHMCVQKGVTREDNQSMFQVNSYLSRK